MATGAIYVDDSGNPGAESGSAFLPDTRKSWTAVVVPPEVAADVDHALQIFLDGVRADYGAEELHFTEIWSGQGVWKAVAPSDRGELISLMATLMDSFALPVVHQTVSDQTLSDHPDLMSGLSRSRTGDWRLDDVSHLGFLFLCREVAVRLRVMAGNAADGLGLPLALYVDEGLLPAGRERALPNWGDVIAGPRACFQRSEDVAGLQLADFAAFIITRAQWTAVNRKAGPEFGKAEAAILEAASRLNVLNLPRLLVRPAEFGRRLYEDELIADRLAKGLSPSPAKRDA